MRLPRLAFRDQGQPLSQKQLSHAAFVLDLPEGYQKFLLWKNGGVPERQSFTWNHPQDGETTSYLNQLFGLDVGPFDNARDLDCIWAILKFRHWLPRWSIPIGFVDEDHFLVTFITGDLADQVWLKYWCHDVPDNDAVPEGDLFFIADSIPAFLHSLFEPETSYAIATFALDSPKVRGKQLEHLLKQLGCKPFKYKGVQYSSTALPPAWTWPKYVGYEEGLAAFVTVEKNNTMGHSPHYADRPKGHKMLRVAVSKVQLKACMQELVDALGDLAELIDRRTRPRRTNR